MELTGDTFDGPPADIVKPLGRHFLAGMRYQVVLEYDPGTGHYTGTVPGMRIIVDAKTSRTAIKWAREAIQMYLEEEAKAKPSRRASLRRERTRSRVVTVEI